jgi:hypothetical protein
MIFAELQNRHGKFGISALAAVFSTLDERGPHYIAKQLTSTSIGVTLPVPY